ncbi:hypothetical protein BGW38_001955, partial [Lunasporangiospora selenospora]
NRGSASSQENSTRLGASKIMNLIRERNQAQGKQINIVVECMAGHVRETIQHMIKMYEPNMLVVGTRGRNAVKGFLMGSISRYCLHHSPIPVIVVRPAEKLNKAKSKAKGIFRRRASSTFLEHPGFLPSSSPPLPGQGQGQSPAEGGRRGSIISVASAQSVGSINSGRAVFGSTTRPKLLTTRSSPELMYSNSFEPMSSPSTSTSLSSPVQSSGAGFRYPGSKKPPLPPSTLSIPPSSFTSMSLSSPTMSMSSPMSISSPMGPASPMTSPTVSTPLSPPEGYLNLRKWVTTEGAMVSSPMSMSPTSSTSSFSIGSPTELADTSSGISSLSGLKKLSGRRSFGKLRNSILMVGAFSLGGRDKSKEKEKGEKEKEK